ncbi:MAG TPA: NAD(P)/FAD-dependent oxidoreductase [Rhodocyclaceae bacterium]|nr:NAD(P)/FAD-dependent oxidoreductase [Rhodocyclaceae bacterium]
MSATDHLDCVVIGAGVVGLACARALAATGRAVLILEAENRFGSGASSRNSEVIHAGLYYRPGSLKASLCVRGRTLLYEYCQERHIPYRRCGKLLVATKTAQLDALDDLGTTARANGVDDLRLIDAAEAIALEPALNCVAALHSPSTGIVDSHALMLSLLADAEADGAVLVLSTPVIAGAAEAGSIMLETGGAEPMRISARTVVNAAGLAAPAIAARLHGLDRAHVPEAYYAKGSYFSLRGKAPFTHLIYPVPEPGGLGVHLTLDLQGRARFGPDVEWLTPQNKGTGLPHPSSYRVDPARAAGFATAIRDYWPKIPPDALDPDYAGIRAKISAPTEAAADFRIDGTERHGIPRLVNLFGIESPGLTSCLAIAERVVDTLRRD